MAVAAGHKEVDYDTQMFHKKFERQAIAETVTKPIFAKYYVCTINPQQSRLFMAFIKTTYEHTSHLLRHLKRVKKVSVEDTTKLKIIVCPIQDITLERLQLQIEEALSAPAPLEVCDIPTNNPMDKETNLRWSRDFWPFVWKGNPLIQELNELYAGFDAAKCEKYMQEVLSISRENDSAAVLFVDPKTDNVKAVVVDSRSQQDPMRHPIMEAIDQIAQQEVIRRSQCIVNDKASNNYLCLNYHVYVSHEPCVMCSMALVHSRINTLVYRHAAPATGGIGKTSGDRYMIHLSCKLNWKFEAYRMTQGPSGANVCSTLNV